MHWQKITLVGVGLLGGSLGLAIKQRRLAAKVDGYVRRTVSIGECEKLGIVDHATRDLHRAVENADLVILCTPLGQMREVTEKMLPALKPGAIVTDVGSVKGSVVEELEPLVKSAGAMFVGSHPMAGGEKTGAAAARADLFV
ncbi:MAG: prephenate dehydrogenase/arogenate dehydrogenase family protein, partial [Pedosphaera sp.]|nr:prephenate dehydrogenase/arogenate dehydrogenase family protein [Pedosphaera sp.]